jgi:hypothetical protein
MATPPIPPTQFAPSGIPPACFYNFQGFAGWLNNNSEYKYLFPELGVPPMTSSLSSIGYTPEGVPLCATVNTLSQGQAFKYNQQLQLFYKVYTYNSNAYVDYINNNTAGPIYFNFFDYKDKNTYNSAVQLVNKLYPFKMMSKIGIQVPFPINA